MAASRRTSAYRAIALTCAVVAGGGAAYAVGTRPGATARDNRSQPLTAPSDAGSATPTPTPHGTPEPQASGDKQRGVALGMFAEDVSFSYAQQLAEVVALGATHVSLTVPIYQTDVRSADLGLHTRFSPTLSLLADTIRLARRDGLEVTVFPILRLRTAKPGEWRGTLAPSNPTEWFRRYADLIGDLAAVANLTGASRFVVGSELSSLDGDVEHWKPLLERIRAVFKGALVYSANWDHFREAKLLDLVDEDGITGYFNLRADERAPSDEPALEEGWRRVKQELDAWHARPAPSAGADRARLPLARRLHRQPMGRGRGRRRRSRGAAARVRGVPPRLGRIVGARRRLRLELVRLRRAHQHQLHAARQAGRG